MSIVQNKVTSILAEWCSLSPEEIQAASSIQELDLDSMNMIEVQLALQHAFNVQLDEDQFFETQTVPALVALVETTVAAETRA